MALELEALRMFVKVAELASFTRAGEHLGLSKARVSVRLQQLEAEVGARLLHRSTRAVRLTRDGEELLPSARRLVDDADQLAGMFAAPSGLRGRVRIDAPQGVARSLLIPAIPALLVEHPGLELQVSSTDRRVDVVREGFDCVLRIGKLDDSGLSARRLGLLPMINCASPAYLRRHGTPRGHEDLGAHLLVHYSLRFGNETPAFEYHDGERWVERPMRSIITVNNGDANLAAALAGLGIIQAPRFGMTARLASGELVEVLRGLTAEPMPLSIVHAHGRAVPRHVRAVMSWIARLLEPHVEAS